MGLASYQSGGTITQLRGLAWLALSAVGNVGAGTVTGDGGGGGTLVWSYGADVPCRIDPLTGQEMLAADRVSDRSTHLITVPPGTSLSASNRFKITGGGTYEVIVVRDATAEPFRFAEVVQVS